MREFLTFSMKWAGAVLASPAACPPSPCVPLSAGDWGTSGPACSGGFLCLQFIQWVNLNLNISHKDAANSSSQGDFFFLPFCSSPHLFHSWFRALFFTPIEAFVTVAPPAAAAVSLSFALSHPGTAPAAFCRRAACFHCSQQSPLLLSRNIHWIQWPSLLWRCELWQETVSSWFCSALCSLLWHSCQGAAGHR